MVNKDANIDLLFRNGLKDLEVLPPVETWGQILPVIRKRQKPLLFLRSAALIAVLLSIGFLAYQWSREMTITVIGPELALGEEPVQSPGNTATRRPAQNSRILVPRTDQSDSRIFADQYDSILVPVEENITVADTGFTFENNRIDFRRNFLLSDNNLISNYGLENSTDAGYDNPVVLSYEVPGEKANRWSVTAMASPTYYMNQLQGSDDISKQISSSEQSRISYSGGVAFAYNISRRFSIQSGIYYSTMGQEVSGISSFGGFSPYDYTKGDENFKVMTSSGLIRTSNTDVFLLDRSGDRVMTLYTNDIFDPAKANLSYINSTLYQNFSYLEMPVILRYKLVDKTFDFNLIGGLSYNLLVNNSVHAMMGKDRYEVGTTDLNPFMISSSLGMGMEYNLTEKFSLNLEPTFRYYLNPIGSVPGMKAHPYSFGIFSGLSFKF